MRMRNRLPPCCLILNRSYECIIIMSSVRTSSSKKRKVDYVWSNVLGCIPEIEDNIKDDAIEKLTQACAPADFITYAEPLREMICEGVGLFGWADKLVSIIELKKRLPSPSNMTWDDVKYILVGEIAKDTTILNDMVEPTDDEKKQLTSYYNLVDKLVAKNSEADSSFRLSIIIFIIFLNLPESKRKEYIVHCQPTIQGHPTFSDYLIEISNGDKCLLIEVKKMHTTTSILLPAVETAQVLREAHIYLQEKRCSNLPFILTNSIRWSFGIAKLVGDKIEVTSIADYYIYANPDSLFKIYSLIRKLIE